MKPNVKKFSKELVKMKGELPYGAVKEIYLRLKANGYTGAYSTVYAVLHGRLMDEKVFLEAIKYRNEYRAIEKRMESALTS